jgi:hypothetical protein
MDSWLWDPAADFKMCVSFRRLAPRLTLHRSTHGWMLDSGAYTELQKYGRWTVDPIRYVQEIDRYDREIGNLEWAAPQDWLCQPWVIAGGWHNERKYAGTGLSVPEHQRLTVANFAELTRWWPEFSDEECPIMPSLQGDTIAAFLHCARLYEDAGIDLSAYPVVGLGSVSDQDPAMVKALAESLTPRLALHGFGLKKRGLCATSRFTSADSTTWSYEARRGAGMPGHQALHKSCANCLDFATQLQWRAGLLTQLEDGDTGTWQVARHAPQVPLTGLAAGFHAVAHLPPGTAEQDVIQAGRSRSVGLYGMSTYRADHAQCPPQLVLGFGNTSQRAIQNGIAVLGDILSTA